MQDYTSNSNKTKQQKVDKPAKTEKTEKNVEKVVVGEVVVQKKSVGRKFKDIFIEADLKSVLRYVGSDVLLPAARNMIVDGATKGVERMMYGDTVPRPRHGPAGSRITYQSPVSRVLSDPRHTRPSMATTRTARLRRDDFILSSREEADLVLERMNDILDTYEVASVADLNELVGMPVSHVDNKWGWVFLGDVQVRQTREGYLLDLPPAEPIQ